MAFDYTNYLSFITEAEAGFIYTNRAGSVDVGVFGGNTAGEWCESLTGTTTSSGTGPTSNPAGRSGFIYTEASTPAASSTWAMRRSVTRDTNAVTFEVDLIYNLNAETASSVIIEYATAVTPNETTDWSILETIPCTLTDSWISDTFDFSSFLSTTLHVRVRCDTDANFTNDIAFSTWHEYGSDKAASETEGYRFRNDNGSETTATWRQGQDTVDSVAKETNLRLRVLTDFTGDPATMQATLQYKRDDEAASEWRDV